MKDSIKNETLLEAYVMISNNNIALENVYACNMCKSCRSGCKSNIYDDEQQKFSDLEVQARFKELVN